MLVIGESASLSMSCESEPKLVLLTLALTLASVDPTNDQQIN
jgi:hypothetical protein